MRAPFCNEPTDLCPDDKGIIGSDNESNDEIHPIERSLGRGQNSKSAVFGICLDELMGTSSKVGPRIPFILSRLCRYIETHGLHHKRLFLETEEKNVVETLKVDFIEYGDAPLETTGSVASAANLLIIFFQELPKPLISGLDQSHFIRDMEKLSISSDHHVSLLKVRVEKLPDPSYQVLKYLSHFLLKIARHEEYNGMSSDRLAVIFVPLIFRPSSNEPFIHQKLQGIVNSFMRNYHVIFNDGVESSCQQNIAPPVKSLTPSSRQLSSRPSAMPVSTLSPLSVVIPPMDATSSSETNESVPLLLIERISDATAKEMTISNPSCSNGDRKTGKFVSRKRKERRLSGEDSQPRSSSEERPNPSSLLVLEKLDQIRRCNSHEEVGEDVKMNEDMNMAFPKNARGKGEASYVDTYLSDTLELVINEKNHSPHPPNAKRREVDTVELIMESSDRWKYHNMSKFSEFKAPTPSDAFLQQNSKQNPIAELSEKSNMECDAEEEEEDLVGEDEFQDSKKAGIPRSASCPVPKTDNEGSESENSSLSLSWSMLFEDSEPVRSENPLNWSPSKQAQDGALLSPSVHNLRNNFYEAPLSPSAYRSYLSHRSSHLDPSVPPSPPVEQEDFAKKLVEGSSVSDSIRQLTKKIHSVKRRLRKFDEKFEADFGYKPSHAEKSNNPEAKKMLSDLYKARKELKALKEEAHLEHVSPASTSWHASHILGDTTNHLQEVKDKSKPSVEDSFGMTMKSLSDERRLASRPETVDDMTTSEVKEEKLAIQKALLHFESIHGKLKTKEERNTIRPLYERYRNVKKLLVRSGSFPVAVSKNKELCSELQPILEHETMDFPSREHRSNKEITNQDIEKPLSENCEDKSEEVKAIPDSFVTSKYTPHSGVLTTKYDNSNFHELPLSEMIFQMQKVKSEKRHLRKILKEFETEFLRLNGRKVQKEDKAPVDTLYGEYKHVKARLKLLEALISKHDQHQLM